MTSPPRNGGRRAGRPPARLHEDRVEVATTPQLFTVDRAPRPQIAQEWDRRRTAEHRLPPLADGRRNPLRRRTTATKNRTVWVEVGPKNTAAVTGDKLIPGIKKLDIPYQWHPLRRDVICIPVNRADDLIAYFEHRCRRRVEVVAVNRI